MASNVLGISFWIFLKRWLGFPQAPDWPLCVQSNTPDGVAFPLPSVAHSCTSAQEKRGAAAPRQECAGSGTISLWETEPVIGSSAMISRLIFCRQPAERQRGLLKSGFAPSYKFCVIDSSIELYEICLPRTYILCSFAFFPSLFNS